MVDGGLKVLMSVEIDGDLEMLVAVAGEIAGSICMEAVEDGCCSSADDGVENDEVVEIE